MCNDIESLVELNLKFNLKSGLCFEASPPNPSREVAGDTIVFRDTQIGSSAVYQCNASNEHGYLLANAFVSVLGRYLRECGNTLYSSCPCKSSLFPSVLLVSYAEVNARRYVISATRLRSRSPLAGTCKARQG